MHTTYTDTQNFLRQSIWWLLLEGSEWQLTNWEAADLCYWQAMYKGQGTRICAVTQPLREKGFKKWGRRRSEVKINRRRSEVKINKQRHCSTCSLHSNSMTSVHLQCSPQEHLQEPDTELLQTTLKRVLFLCFQMLSDVVKKQQDLKNFLSLQEAGFLLLVIHELLTTITIRSWVSAFCSISFAGLWICTLPSAIESASCLFL